MDIRERIKVDISIYDAVEREPEILEIGEATVDIQKPDEAWISKFKILIPEFWAESPEDEAAFLESIPDKLYFSVKTTDPVTIALSTVPEGLGEDDEMFPVLWLQWLQDIQEEEEW